MNKLDVIFYVVMTIGLFTAGSVVGFGVGFVTGSVYDLSTNATYTTGECVAASNHMGTCSAVRYFEKTCLTPNTMVLLCFLGLIAGGFIGMALRGDKT